MELTRTRLGHSSNSRLRPQCVVSAGVNVWALSAAGGARAPSTWRTAQPSIAFRTCHMYGCCNHLRFVQRGLDPLAYRRGGDGTVVYQFPGADYLAGGCELI